ncbi:MAG: hypothetical protein LUE10_00735, partial [Alistipes sp.]|nr:hypothetical protein [Alistipes sp.]
ITVLIERDYILVLLKQLARLIAQLTRLKTAGELDAMDNVIYDALDAAGIDGQDPLTAREKIDRVEDDRILVSLHEALTVYLSMKMDIKLSMIDDVILESLKGRKNSFWTFEQINYKNGRKTTDRPRKAEGA